MFNKIADWLIERSKRTPFIHLPGYMNRWWLLPYGWLTKWKGRYDFAVRIHEILRSDSDRAYHDHPGPYLSVVLKVGYWEVTPKYDRSGLYVGESREWYGPGSIILRGAKSWHRLEIPEGQVAVTLFFTFGYKQKWGFMPNPVTKIRYEEYLKGHQQ